MLVDSVQGLRDVFFLGLSDRSSLERSDRHSGSRYHSAAGAKLNSGEPQSDRWLRAAMNSLSWLLCFGRLLVIGSSVAAVVLVAFWAVSYREDCEDGVKGFPRPAFLRTPFPTPLDCDFVNTVWWPLAFQTAALVTLAFLGLRVSWLYSFRLHALGLVVLGTVLCSDAYSLWLIVDDENSRDDDRDTFGFAGLVLFDLLLLTMHLRRATPEVEKCADFPSTAQDVSGRSRSRATESHLSWGDNSVRGMSLRFLKPSRGGKPPLITIAVFLALGVLGWILAFSGTVRVWDTCTDAAEDATRKCAIFLESWFSVAVCLVVWVMLGLAGVCGDAPEVWRPGLGAMLGMSSVLAADQVDIFFNDFYQETYGSDAKTAGAGFVAVSIANIFLTFVVCYRFPSTSSAGRGVWSIKDLIARVDKADNVGPPRKMALVGTMAAGVGAWVVALESTREMDANCDKFDGKIVIVMPGYPTQGNCDEFHNSYWALTLSMCIFAVAAFILSVNCLWPTAFLWKIENWQVVGASFLIVSITESASEARDLWPAIMEEQYGTVANRAKWAFFALMMTQTAFFGLVAYDVVPAPDDAAGAAAAAALPTVSADYSRRAATPAPQTVVVVGSGAREERGIRAMIESFYRNDR